MTVTTMNSDGVFIPLAYSHIGIAGDLVFLAGQVGRGPDGPMAVPNDTAAQARQLFANLGQHLRTIGATPADVVKVNTILVDRADRDAVGAEHKKFFGDHKPPNTLVIVAGLASPELRAEVEVIVYRPRLA